MATLTLLSSRLARRELSEALEWAEANMALLQAKWKELNP